MGITKLKKGSKGAVIMGCETEKEMKNLKDTVQDKLGENFSVSESLQIKHKVKIINVGEEEMTLGDKELMDTIKKQNKIDINDGTQLRVVKRIVKGKGKDSSQTNRGGRGCEGSVIIEVDKETHEVVLQKEKLNIGWRKCRVFNHINVKRCFKCWGFYHSAKNCMRDEACYKCAGNHKASTCTVLEKKCVNCMLKNRTYNLKISDDHDAFNPECPTYKRVMEEEKRRAGWEDTR